MLGNVDVLGDVDGDDIVEGVDDCSVDGLSVSTLAVLVGKELGDQLGPCVLECWEGTSLDPSVGLTVAGPGD